MRTHLLRAVPSTDADADTGLAANDALYGIGAALAARSPAAHESAFVPTVVAANRDEEHYWLDGYAGI